MLFRVLIVCAIALMVVLPYMFPVRHDLRCLERWEDTGYTARWTDTQGCYVQQDDGRWLPENFMKRK